MTEARRADATPPIAPACREAVEPADRAAAYAERFGAGRGLDADRMLEIRLRIASGFYNRPGVHQIVAERMLKAGDIKIRP